ncbi:MAG: 2-amino-4-hydroxy-6-hydroxymethyldihydropteridine diphosphokinase [Bacteroidales bacterium 36-12]|nr:MAG: 2-amino-4-hydroxy-6-hydroxymethyldihydropteridine diphosphokinase [Bacteroidales bacterium 36-12]
MKVYLGLGSNIGDKKGNIDYAIRKIDELLGTVKRKSGYFESLPWGFESKNDFINVAIMIETDLDPLELLYQLQQIEIDMGREEKTSNGEYTDRIIDIDILLYEDLVIDLPELKVPHPLMEERDFVMKPLKEILG